MILQRYVNLSVTVYDETLQPPQQFFDLLTTLGKQIDFCNGETQEVTLTGIHDTR